MASPHKHKPVSVLDPQFVHTVYIPSALLMVGTLIVKREWWPFALLVAVGLGGWNIYSSRKLKDCTSINTQSADHRFFSRGTEGSQAKRVPRIRAEGEDCVVSQYRDARFLP